MKLIIGPYVFKKRKVDKSGRTTFTCNDCEKLKVHVAAFAQQNSDDNYTLISYPPSEVHRCTPSSTAALVTACMDNMKKKVFDQPTREILTIYEEMRLEYSSKLAEQERKAFLSEIPPYRSAKAELYRQRRQRIPALPLSMISFNMTGHWFVYNNQTGENVILGEKVIGQKKIVVFSTKEHVKILCRCRTVSGDGTFKITPSLWYQTFILAGEVVPEVWVPLIYAILPDKQKTSYEAMFEILLEAVEAQNLALSAEWFLSDYEDNIRNSFAVYFPKTQIKGCQFHFSQALWKRVNKANLRSEYSKKKNAAFANFIRACVGISFVPLNQLDNALNVLRRMGRELKEQKFRDFSKNLVDYLNTFWLNGRYSRESWNHFVHRGASTNNANEGYNSRLNNKKTLNKHPNPYQFIQMGNCNKKK